MIRVQEAENLKQMRAVMTGEDADKTSHVTIFHGIFHKIYLPASERGEMRLIAEAVSLLGTSTVITLRCI